MKRMSIEKEKITVDYTAAGMPESVRNFRPEVYRDGDTYCSILGTDPDQGIFGYGDTVQEALTDWDLAYRKRQQQRVSNKDEVGKYIRETEKWPEDKPEDKEVRRSEPGSTEQDGPSAADRPRK